MLSTNINLTFSQFVVKVRALFLAEFANHKELFPGVDGETMFVGTVLHSLDHVSHFIQSLLHEKTNFSTRYLESNQHHRTNAIFCHKIKYVKVKCIHDTQLLHRQVMDLMVVIEHGVKHLMKNIHRYPVFDKGYD